MARLRSTQLITAPNEPTRAAGSHSYAARTVEHGMAQSDHPDIEPALVNVN